MKFNIQILKVKPVSEISDYWTFQDIKQLLEAFDYPEADQADPSEIEDLLLMAITDFEPEEAAARVLQYKLGDRLNQGQIRSLSNEMIDDKVAEEYPDPSFHYDLFNINQLLFKAFNGTFPNTEATLIELEISPDVPSNDKLSETILKVLVKALKNSSVINRLYGKELEGAIPFNESGKIIWRIYEHGNGKYGLLTSEYWIEKEDFVQSNYIAQISYFDDED